MTRDEWISPDVFLKVGIGETSVVPRVNQDRFLEGFSSSAASNRQSTIKKSLFSKDLKLLSKERTSGSRNGVPRS